MNPLKRGDPVKVRLHTGEVVEAVYDNLGLVIGHCVHHYLRDHSGKILIAVKGRPTEHDHECRFVGNPCSLVPVE